jgi:hypothetical protein
MNGEREPQLRSKRQFNVRRCELDVEANLWSKRQCQLQRQARFSLPKFAPTTPKSISPFDVPKETCSTHLGRPKGTKTIDA